MGQATTIAKPFLTDVQTLRDRARKNLNDGALGSNYVGDVSKTIEILQAVLATELVCVLRYTMHSIAASGISSESVKAEFATHAKEELDHVHMVAERINQLGGTPNFNPEGLATRSARRLALRPRPGHALAPPIGPPPCQRAASPARRSSISAP
jgi:bacterioferritin